MFCSPSAGRRTQINYPISLNPWEVINPSPVCQWSGKPRSNREKWYMQQSAFSQHSTHWILGIPCGKIICGSCNGYVCQNAKCQWSISLELWVLPRHESKIVRLEVFVMLNVRHCLELQKRLSNGESPRNLVE